MRQFYRPEPEGLVDILEADTNLDINMGNITIAEVKEAIKKLKNGKAPGVDGVCPEMLKVEEQVAPEFLGKSKAYGKVSPPQMNGEQD